MLLNPLIIKVKDTMKKTNPSTKKVVINSRSVLVSLLAVTGVIVSIHLLLQFLLHFTTLPLPDTLVGRLDVDNEISIPTWWSQTILLIVAVTSLAAWKVGGSHWWITSSGLFLFLSVDEGAMLHEAFITKFREWTTDGTATGLTNHLWIIPVVILALLLLIPFIQLLRTLNRRNAILLATGIGLFAFGAVVYETFGLIVFSGIGGFWYHGLNVAIEELLEMTGVSLSIYAVLEEIRRQSSELSLSLKK